jgi:hypothetical protein
MQFGIGFLNKLDPDLTSLLASTEYWFIVRDVTWDETICDHISPFEVLKEFEHPDVFLPVVMEHGRVNSFAQLTSDVLVELEIRVLDLRWDITDHEFISCSDDTES